MGPPDVLSMLHGSARPGIAVEDADHSIGYAELATSVRLIAGALGRQGVSPGDRVAVMVPNCVASVQMYLACALTGAIWVGLNPAAPEAERDRQCALVRPTLIVTSHLASWVPPAGRVVELGALRAGPPDPYDAAAPELSAPCAVGFSSGTTATPKAFLHSRAAVSLTAAALAGNRLRTDDRVGVILPMSIHNLIVVGALPALLAGATCVAVDRMNAPAVAAACRDRQLTMLNALVPATIYDLVHDDAVTPGMLSSLRVAGTGAAGLTESLRTEFEAKFGVRVAGSYGLTEAPGVVCIEDPAEPHVPGSSGRPLPHLEVDACDGSAQPMPPGHEGELCVRPRRSGRWAGLYRPAIGVWTEDGVRSRAEQVLRTGDYGWVDDDGAVHVSGRQADVLVRGGVNVNAAELEHVLGRLSGIREVAVIGEPDDRLGQRIVAYVEAACGASLDPAALRDDARDVLAHGKVPDEFIVGTLPRNAMGKVARADLRRTDHERY